MFRLDSTLEINAPIEHVWQAVMDLGSYKKWCSTLSFQEGTRVSLGSTVYLESIPADGSGKTLQKSIRFTSVDTCRELAWKSGSFPLFSTLYFWNLETVNPVRTRLILGQEFGFLPTLLAGKKKLSAQLPYFQKIGEELRLYTESRFVR